MESSENAGESLGLKHKNYNKLLKDFTINSAISQQSKIDYDEPDLGNLFKIDVACKTRNVEYILEVLKCGDMLYVSRALNNSTWIITDEQYAHIINPEYLHYHIFPQMMSKAIKKFILLIRLNLKIENRVEQFFEYYKELDLKVALKWLLNCSLPFIERVVKNHANNITIPLWTRLCKKSITVLEIAFKNCNLYHKKEILHAASYAIKKHTEIYLDIIDTIDEYEVPNLGPKQTKIIMQKFPLRVLNNFRKYVNNIHLPTFVKFLKKEELKDFLLKQYKDKNMQYWFCYDNLKHFILNMANENRFKFVRKFIIDNKKDNANTVMPMEGEKCILLSVTDVKNYNSLQNIYLWYEFATFEIAFTDIKKLIQSESSPAERISMLNVLLKPACRNRKYITVLLQYFRDKHINEPLKFKINFINEVLHQVDIQRFDKKTWCILNEIFCSMDVYSENESNIQSCIIAIIVYKTIYNEVIPELLENKFNFVTLKEYKKKLNAENGEKLFNYLYTMTAKNIINYNLIIESDCKKAVKCIRNIFNLINDWERQLIDYPLIIEKVREILNFTKQFLFNINMSFVYDTKKSWRKYFFADSLDLWPKQEACINALKHDPKLLLKCKKAMEVICCDDNVSLRIFLNKLRTYWPQSIAKDIISIFLQQLNYKSGLNAIFRGLIILMPQNELINLVSKYAPIEEKIIWNENDGILINIRKNIAKNIHFARPQLPIDIILCYGKGDYLQFIVPALNSILYNMSVNSSQKHVNKLIEAPVSLQKHGIRVACKKLKIEEVTIMLSGLWKDTKNSSIRANLFKNTFKLLCKEKNTSKIETIWLLLDTFIDTLTTKENKSIYIILGKVDQVPCSVKVAFWKRSYNFLKILPAKAKCDRILHNVLCSAGNFMAIIDVDYFAKIFLERFTETYTRETNYDLFLVSQCILSGKIAEVQYERYKKLFLPMMERSIASWNVSYKDENYVRRNFFKLFKHMCGNLRNALTVTKVANPVNVFKSIQSFLEQNLSHEENYTLLRISKFATAIIEVLHMITVNVEKKNDLCSGKTVHDNWNEFTLRAAPNFSQKCLQYLKEDIELYSSLIYTNFGTGMKIIFNILNINDFTVLQILQSMLQTEVKESYMLALNLIPKHLSDENEKAKRSEIINMFRSHSSPEVRHHYYCYSEKEYVQ